MDTNSVVIEGIYPAGTKKVWQAISELEALRKWYFPLDGFEAVKGFRFQFPGGNDKGQTYIHLCEVLEVKEGEKLSYTWQYEGMPGYTVVSFELFKNPGGTLLRLTHTGLETLAAAGPDFARENFVGGWTYFVQTALPNYLKEQT